MRTEKMMSLERKLHDSEPIPQNLLLQALDFIMLLPESLTCSCPLPQASFGTRIRVSFEGGQTMRGDHGSCQKRWFGISSMAAWWHSHGWSWRIMADLHDLYQPAFLAFFAFCKHLPAWHYETISKSPWNLKHFETKEPAAAWITCIAVGSCIWIWNLPTSCCMWMRLLVKPLRFHVHFYRTLAPVRWWAMSREKFMVAMPLSSALPNVWRTRKLERKEMGWRWVQLMVCLKVPQKPLTVVGQWNKRCMYADACRNTFKTKTQSALKSLEDFTCFNIFSHTLRKKNS